MKRQSKFFGEFKKFILRGNVMDMAVGVIVGGAFTSIVTSLNADILTPILGIFGGTDFSYLTVTLRTGENAPVLHYGNFITAVINFSDHGTCDFYYIESYQPDHRKTEHVSRYGGRKAGTDNKKMSILLFGN